MGSELVLEPQNCSESIKSAYFGRKSLQFPRKMRDLKRLVGRPRTFDPLFLRWADHFDLLKHFSDQKTNKDWWKTTLETVGSIHNRSLGCANLGHGSATKQKNFAIYISPDRHAGALPGPQGERHHHAQADRQQVRPILSLFSFVFYQNLKKNRF